MRSIPDLVMALDDGLPGRQLMPLDVSRPGFNATPMLDGIGADHFDFAARTPARRATSSQASRVACTGFTVSATTILPMREIVLRHAIGDRIARRPDIGLQDVAGPHRLLDRVEPDMHRPQSLCQCPGDGRLARARQSAKRDEHRCPNPRLPSRPPRSARAWPTARPRPAGCLPRCWRSRIAATGRAGRAARTSPPRRCGA